MKSVAVITATRGRATLQATLDSVQNQTYPCKHYVVFNGVKLGELDANIKFPSAAEAIWLPNDTGANGFFNAAICAMAPFFAVEDYICYLDDDNWFEPDHVQSMVEACEANNAAYAYSLRKLVNPDGSFWANDDGESLGHHGDLVDVNCYLLRRDLGVGLAPLWYRSNGEKMVGDRFVWTALVAQKVPWAATKRYTVNYRISARQDMKPFFFLRNIGMRTQYPDGFPWAA